MEKIKKFKIVVSGLGGQGVISSAKILANAAMLQGYDVKMSELHGLSQRMGHAESHVIFGDKIYSSLVKEGKADLIIALEPLEALRVCKYASKETILVLNNYPIIPISVYEDKKEYPSDEFIMNHLKSIFKEVISINISEIVQKETSSFASVNIFMLALSCAKKFLPLDKQLLKQSVKEIISKNQEVNEKIFDLASKHN